MAANDIFETNLGHLKGNTTRRESQELIMTCIEITPETDKRYKNITLSLEIIL